MFNWAIIGTGGIANRFVSVLGSKTQGCLYGVLATSHFKAEQFLSNKDQFSDKEATIFENLEALLNDSDVDAIYIATPHTYHYEYAKKALQHGIPVLCEKPLTVTAAETQELIKIAQQNKTFLMEALWTKTLPAWKRVKEVLEEGVIGEVDHYSADMGFFFKHDPSHRLFNKGLAGGVLLDLGVYPISLVTNMSGMPTGVLATAIIGDTGVDIKTLVSLSFDDQVTASITLTTRSTTENAFWIYGSKGRICVANLFSAAQSLIIEVGDNRCEESYPFELNGFEYQIRESIACINSGEIENPNVTHAETLSVMRVLDQIRSQIGVTYPEDSALSLYSNK